MLQTFIRFPCIPKRGGTGPKKGSRGTVKNLDGASSEGVKPLFFKYLRAGRLTSESLFHARPCSADIVQSGCPWTRCARGRMHPTS